MNKNEKATSEQIEDIVDTGLSLGYLLLDLLLMQGQCQCLLVLNPHQYLIEVHPKIN